MQTIVADRAAAMLAQHPRGMRIVDHRDRAIVLGQIGDSIERRDIAIHAEHTVGDNQRLGVLALVS